VPSPPLLRSLPLALTLGALGGTLVAGVLLREQVAWPWWPLVAFGAGAPLGAISGLDLLLPGPGGGPMGKPAGRGPFTSTVTFCLGVAGCLAAAAYSTGRLEFVLEKDAQGRTSITRRTSAWLGRVHESTRIDGVQGAEQARTSRVVVRHGAPGELPEVYDPAPPDFADRINAFLAGSSGSQVVASHALAYFKWIFLACAAGFAVAARYSSRWALRMAREHLLRG
jgi:hypothetical protein